MFVIEERDRMVRSDAATMKTLQKLDKQLGGAEPLHKYMPKSLLELRLDGESSFSTMGPSFQTEVFCINKKQGSYTEQGYETAEGWVKAHPGCDLWGSLSPKAWPTVRST